MCYLHTAFDQPLIHRDLKSPNVLFTASPSDRDCVAKITDFGLARDKADDDNMTGCGSVLWMAPEILLGEPYTEKVDVFSYAMVLVEMIDQKLPWTGVASGAEVPHRVTRNRRPENHAPT